MQSDAFNTASLLNRFISFKRKGSLYTRSCVHLINSQRSKCICRRSKHLIRKTYGFQSKSHFFVIYIVDSSILITDILQKNAKTLRYTATVQEENTTQSLDAIFGRKKADEMEEKDSRDWIRRTFLAPRHDNDLLVFPSNPYTPPINTKRTEEHCNKSLLQRSQKQTGVCKFHPFKQVSIILIVRLLFLSKPMLQFENPSLL